MELSKNAVDILQVLFISLGAGIATWGAINLMEGYGNDNPDAKSQGIRQLMVGGGIILVAVILLRP